MVGQFCTKSPNVVCIKEPCPSTILVGTKEETPPSSASGASVQAEREKVNSRKTMWNRITDFFLAFIEALPFRLLRFQGVVGMPFLLSAVRIYSACSRTTFSTLSRYSSIGSSVSK